MRVAVFGAGATGARVARKLATSDEVERVSVHDPDPQRLDWVVSSLGPTAAAAETTALDRGTDVWWWPRQPEPSSTSPAEPSTGERRW